jgi:hypothetical protein
VNGSEQRMQKPHMHANVKPLWVQTRPRMNLFRSNRTVFTDADDRRVEDAEKVSSELKFFNA